MDYYLSTYDVDFRAPEEKGIAFEQFKDLVDGIPARKRLILIDACNSGEIDRTTDGDAGQTKTRFFANAGLHNSFELMKDLFVELRKESGATIFASSAGGAFSYESDQWKNGVFTFALKEAILNQMADQNEDEHITVSELKEYLFNRVSELTNGQQTPTVRQENLQTNWRIY